MIDTDILPYLHILIGGLVALVAAALAGHFGIRSADRMPGESRLPQCLYCQKDLRWFECLPLVGWLARRRAILLACPCGKRIGQWAQPAAEIIGFLLGATAISLSGLSPATLALCVGLGLLPAIAVIDLMFGVIPDGLNLALGLVGIVWLLLGGGDIFLGLVVASGLLAFSLFLAIVYSKWRGRDMLGLGDVKFFTAAGLWLPVTLLPWFLAAAGVIGAIVGVVWQRISGNKESPFAPALCAALAGCLLYQLASLHAALPL